MKTHGKYVTLD